MSIFYKMRIVYIFRAIAVWGGIERVLVEKMNHLITMYGDDVYMLTTDQGDHPVPYQMTDGVHHEDLGILFHRQYRYSGVIRLLDGWQRKRLFEKRLSERIRQIQPDVIVCTTADPVYSIAKTKGLIPLVVESHSICVRTLGEKSLRQRVIAKLMLKGLRKAACMVTLTESDATEWRKNHSHVEVIPNIVHINQGLLASLEIKRVIWVGRFDYQKRPMEIIMIWKLIYPQFPTWHLDIYGEGEQIQELIDEVTSSNMNIHIHHPTEQIFDAYRDSSILVSTSLFEPFGLVIPEAMSCGLPVVAYNSPYGPSVIISDGKTGFLVDNNNRQAFADKLCLLMSEISLRQRMGKAAFVSAQRFSAGNIMPKWRELFLSLLYS